jgi:hypothetical protein
MSTGTTRLMIVVALVVAGAAVLLNGFAADTGIVAGGETPSPSETPTPTETETPPPDGDGEPVEPSAPSDVRIAVFNGAGVTGLAAQVTGRLVNREGYVQGLAPGDWPESDIEKTIVYFTGGGQADQNRVDAQVIADSFLDGARVRELDEQLADDLEIPRSVDVVIVVGRDYAEAHA